MENKKSLDHLFGPKDSSPSSSDSFFGSIFSQPSTGPGRNSAGIMASHQGGRGKYGNPESKNQKGQSSGMSGKDKNSSVYQNETTEPCNFSSSIYYGGQENYSPRTNNSESQQTFKKAGGDDDPNGNNSNGASRGNWWQGSLYY